MALHEAAMKDDYFISRKLAPNVDFWSGLIYRAMGMSTFLQIWGVVANEIIF